MLGRHVETAQNPDARERERVGDARTVARLKLVCSPLHRDPVGQPVPQVHRRRLFAHLESARARGEDVLELAALQALDWHHDILAPPPRRATRAVREQFDLVWSVARGHIESPGAVRVGTCGADGCAVTLDLEFPPDRKRPSEPLICVVRGAKVRHVRQHGAVDRARSASGRRHRAKTELAHRAFAMPGARPAPRRLTLEEGLCAELLLLQFDAASKQLRAQADARRRDLRRLVEGRRELPIHHGTIEHFRLIFDHRKRGQAAIRAPGDGALSHALEPSHHRHLLHAKKSDRQRAEVYVGANAQRARQ